MSRSEAEARAATVANCGRGTLLWQPIVAAQAAAVAQRNDQAIKHQHFEAFLKREVLDTENLLMEGHGLWASDPNLNTPQDFENVNLFVKLALDKENLCMMGYGPSAFVPNLTNPQEIERVKALIQPVYDACWYYMKKGGASDDEVPEDDADISLGPYDLSMMKTMYELGCLTDTDEIRCLPYGPFKSIREFFKDARARYFANFSLQAVTLVVPEVSCPKYPLPDFCTTTAILPRAHYERADYERAHYERAQRASDQKWSE